jgi:hypothetical protein
MENTLTIPQVGLRSRRTYNQVMADLLRGRLSGYQDLRGRWHVVADARLDTYASEVEGARRAKRQRVGLAAHAGEGGDDGD